MTLQQLLSTGASEWNAVEKLVLSVILGYSLFYFYDGAWLGGKWSRDNILFFTQTGSIPLQPFLRSRRCPDAHGAAHFMDEDSIFHRYPSILEFGVTLLEIDLGRSLESFPSRIKEIKTIDDQYAKACEVFKIRKPYILSKHYREAIYACLYQDFSDAENDGAEQFRHQIYECIVRPLEEELHNSCQEFISLDSLDAKASSMDLGSVNTVPELQRLLANPSLSNMMHIRHDSGGERGTQTSNSVQHKSQRSGATFKDHSINSYQPCPSPRQISPSTLHMQSRPSSIFADYRPSRRDEFEIAVICALKREYDAVAFLFDEYLDEEGDVYGRAPGDQNTYMTGRIGKYNVVLVLLSDMGKVPAASAAANFRSSYRNIHLALLVGICGGVPKDNEGREILLGDVIVSTQIIEYDRVRRFPDKPRRKTELSESHGRANTDIRGFVGTLQTNFQSKRLETRTAHYLTELQGKVNSAEYEYPGASNDKLFHSTYRHKHHDIGRCAICHKCLEKSHPVCDSALTSSCRALRCDDQYLVTRERLTRKADSGTQEVQNPVIRFGSIASGDSVMKSGNDRDEIARVENIIAFEMEGSGVWDSLPCIIIKGVCDYADSHKNKDWQSFACATAASAMKAILERYVRTDK